FSGVVRTTRWRRMVWVDMVWFWAKPLRLMIDFDNSTNDRHAAGQCPWIFRRQFHAPSSVLRPPSSVVRRPAPGPALHWLNNKGRALSRSLTIAPSGVMFPLRVRLSAFLSEGGVRRE